MKTKFTINIYRYYDEDNDGQFIKGGSIVRFLHSEKGGFLHSDDKDFTDDGLAEVYCWNFKGKVTDLEANSSSSLFEVELASPMIDFTQNTKVAPGGEQQTAAGQDKRSGRVFNYSVQGGIKEQSPADQATPEQ